MDTSLDSRKVTRQSQTDQGGPMTVSEALSFSKSGPAGYQQPQETSDILLDDAQRLRMTPNQALPLFSPPNSVSSTLHPSYLDDGNIDADPETLFAAKGMLSLDPPNNLPSHIEPLFPAELADIGDPGLVTPDSPTDPQRKDQASSYPWTPILNHLAKPNENEKMAASLLEDLFDLSGPFSPDLSTGSPDHCGCSSDLKRKASACDPMLSFKKHCCGESPDKLDRLSMVISRFMNDLIQPSQRAPNTTSATDNSYLGHPQLFHLRCMHASTAQKSYGNEKRFLCPPPVVSLDIQALSKQTLESNMGNFSLKCSVTDCNPSADSLSAFYPSLSELRHEGDFYFQRMQNFWRSLHVASEAISESRDFSLSIGLFRSESLDRARTLMPSQSLPRAPLYQFTTELIPVISKPCRSIPKKKAILKAALRDGSLVCFWNRINSQTARTRYLGLGSACPPSNESFGNRVGNRGSTQFRTDADAWTPLMVRVLKEPQLSDVPREVLMAHQEAKTPQGGKAGLLLYGSTVQLVQPDTNQCSEPLRLIRVTEGGAASSECAAILQLQRVAFERIVAPTPASSGQSAPEYMATDVRHVKAKDFGRHVISKESNSPVKWINPDGPQDCELRFSDEACWTVAGIRDRSIRFLDIPAAQNLSCPPTQGIGCLPRVVSPPRYIDDAFGPSVEFQVNDFASVDMPPDHFVMQSSVWQIYLGHYGPLSFNIGRSLETPDENVSGKSAARGKRTGLDDGRPIVPQERVVLTVKLPILCDPGTTIPLLVVQHISGDPSAPETCDYRVFVAGCDIYLQ